jgi:hypothetical protein
MIMRPTRQAAVARPWETVRQVHHGLAVATRRKLTLMWNTHR